MKNLLATALLAAATLLWAAAAQAQTTAPDFPTQPAANAPRPAAKLPVDAARAKRQAQMSPEDAARDQQLQVMEARTGNTSFGMERGGPAKDNTTGGFTVRKFRELRGQEQQKGTTRRVLMGARTTGEPLVHKHKTGKKHKFLFF